MVDPHLTQFGLPKIFAALRAAFLLIFSAKRPPKNFRRLTAANLARRILLSLLFSRVFSSPGAAGENFYFCYWSVRFPFDF